ncbi:hypothetical protein ERO13_D04G013066v2 [Gossypium hirsutum]|nr:hypothetical protein ERO13_D04G013066v2 [Gossypium hirsutum]
MKKTQKTNKRKNQTKPEQESEIFASLYEILQKLLHRFIGVPGYVMGGENRNKRKPARRQNLLLSATLNEKVNHLSKISLEILGDYRLPAQLVQRLLSCVFFTCDAVDFLHAVSEFQWSPYSQFEEELKQMFLKCKTFRLHGNMKQEDRRTTFSAFKTEKSALLVSTICIIQYDSPGEASEYVHRVGRTARLGEEEILTISTTNRSGLLARSRETWCVIDRVSTPQNNRFFPIAQSNASCQEVCFFRITSMVVSLQRELESYISAEPKIKKQAKDAFCSWVRAYTAHRGDLKQIFMVKKLHLGHVAKSFALREQPSLVGKAFQNQSKKRKRDLKQKQKGLFKKRKVASKT